MFKKPMEKLKSGFLWFLVWLVVPVVSAFLFTVYFIFFSNWKINEDISINIDISNLIAIFVAIVITVILGRRLGKKDEVSKIKYTNMCNLLGNFEEDFKRKIKNIIEVGSTDIKKINLLLQNHGARINKIKQLAVQHNYINKDSSDFLNIEKNFTILRKIIDEPSSAVTSTDSAYTYSNDQICKLDEIIDERQLLIFELTVLLSNHH